MKFDLINVWFVLKFLLVIGILVFLVNFYIVGILIVVLGVFIMKGYFFDSVV